jgi:hypothetical protein
MESALLNRLRSEMRIVLVVGAVGSLGLMLRAARHTPRFLLVLFVLWILLPFAVLLWGVVASVRWAALTRVTLYTVAVLVTVASLALYGGLVHRPAGSANAFMYVVVPPASLGLVAISVTLAALKTRRRSRRATEPR